MPKTATGIQLQSSAKQRQECRGKILIQRSKLSNDIRRFKSPAANSRTMKEQSAILNKQVRDWTSQLQRLAAQIAVAKGVSCAVVMIAGTDEGYADVAPELIL